MGKGKVIQSTKMVDCANVGGARLQIIQVDFEGGKDFYAVVEDESKMGLLLAAAFGNTPNNACGCCKYGRIFKGEPFA